MAGKTVLIVDDSTTMRTLLKMALAGIDLIKPPIIIEAVDGLDGLNKFRSSALDFIITDIKMPNMDGLQFIAAVRKENQVIPIIVLSTKGEESSIRCNSQIDCLLLSEIEMDNTLLGKATTAL